MNAEQQTAVAAATMAVEAVMAVAVLAVPALRATCKIIQPLNARAGRVWGFCRILAVNRFFLVVRADIRGFWTRKSIALIK